MAIDAPALPPVEVDEFNVHAAEPDLKARLQKVIADAQAIDVINEFGFRQITAIYAKAKSWEKEIEFFRKQANQPDQDRINARNDKAREVLIPLKQIQEIAKQKSARYQLMLEDFKRKEEQKLIDAAELIGVSDVPAPAPEEKSVRGDGAMMITRTVRRFRIVDEALIPDKYFVVDIDAIERDIKLGVAEIPGVEMWEEKISQLKTR